MDSSFAKKFFVFGFVPTLFGGLVLEESKGHFTNLVQLYFWILLFAIPFIIAALVPDISLTMAMIYPLILAAVYALILWINSFLHACFDRDVPVTTTTVIQDDDGQPTERTCRVCNTTFRSRLTSRLCLQCLLAAEESSDLSVREAWPIWFHGNISRRSAESILSRIRPGSYLVRFSSKNTGDLVLSFRNRSGPIHFLISHKFGEFSIGDSSFGTLTEAIEHYTTHVLNDGMPLLFPVASSSSQSNDRRRERTHRRRSRSRLSIEGQPIEFFEDTSIADLFGSSASGRATNADSDAQLPPDAIATAAAAAAATAAAAAAADSLARRPGAMTDNADEFMSIEELGHSYRVSSQAIDEASQLRPIAEAVSESPAPSASDALRSTAGTAGESAAEAARAMAATAADSSGNAAAAPPAQLRTETIVDPDPSFSAEPLTLAALLEHYKQYIPEDAVISVPDTEDPLTLRQAFLRNVVVAAIAAVETAMNTMSANAQMWQDHGQDDTAAECVRLASQYRPLLDELVRGRPVRLTDVPLRVSPLSSDDFEIFGLLSSPVRRRRSQRRETRSQPARPAGLEGAARAVVPRAIQRPSVTAGMPVSPAIPSSPPSASAPPAAPHIQASPSTVEFALMPALTIPSIVLESPESAIATAPTAASTTTTNAATNSVAPPLPPRMGSSASGGADPPSSLPASPSASGPAPAASSRDPDAAVGEVNTVHTAEMDLHARAESVSQIIETELQAAAISEPNDDVRSARLSISSAQLHSGSDGQGSAARPTSASMSMFSAVSLTAPTAVAAVTNTPPLPPTLFTPVPPAASQGSRSPLRLPDGHTVSFANDRCGEADLSGALQPCGCSTFRACPACPFVSSGYPCCGEGLGAPCSRPAALDPLALTPTKRPAEPPSGNDSEATPAESADEEEQQLQQQQQQKRQEAGQHSEQGSPRRRSSSGSAAGRRAGRHSPANSSPRRPDAEGLEGFSVREGASMRQMLEELGLENVHIHLPSLDLAGEAEEPSGYVPQFSGYPRRQQMLALGNTPGESQVDELTSDSDADAPAAEEGGDKDKASTTPNPPLVVPSLVVEAAADDAATDMSAPSALMNVIASSNGGAQGSVPPSVTDEPAAQAALAAEHALPSGLSAGLSANLFVLLPMSVYMNLLNLPFFHARCTRERAEAALLAECSADDAENVNAPKQVITLFAFEASSEDELSFERGAVLDLLDGFHDDWWRARNQSTGAEGFVPSNYVVATEALPQPRDGTFMLWCLRETRSPLCISIRHRGHVDHLRVIVTAPSGQAATSTYSLQCVDAINSDEEPRITSEVFHTLQSLVDAYRHQPFSLTCDQTVRLTEFVTQAQINRRSGLPPALPPRTYVSNESTDDRSGGSASANRSWLLLNRDNDEREERGQRRSSTASSGPGRRHHRQRFYSHHHRHSLAEYRHFGHGWICDVCGEQAAEYARRYRCTHACDYDLCQGCLDSSALDAESHREAFYPNADGRGSQVERANPSISRTVTRAQICGRQLSLPFDRLQLTNMIDQMQFTLEICACVVLAFLTPFTGLMISSFYADLGLFVLWLVVASALYALLKSVQPDGGCFMLGTRVSAYSRALLFCALAGILLLLDKGAHGSTGSSSFYGVPYPSASTLAVLSQTVQILILCIPALFVFNIMPCWKTFCHYVLEQLDMHVFGGNGTASLWASLIAGTFDVAFVGLLFCICRRANYDCGSQACSGNVIVSVFGGFALAFAFLLARVDPDIVGRLLRFPFFADCELPNANYLVSLVGRFVIYFVVATVIALSGVFTALQPALNSTFYAIACAAGFIILIQHDLRIVHPWGFLRQPVIPPVNLDKRGQRFVELSRIEKLLFVLRLLEHNIVYPVILLGCIARDRPLLVSRFGEEGAAAVLSFAALKFARLALSNRRLVWMALVAALLFFNYDFQWSSQSLLVDVFFTAIIIYKLEEFVLKLRYVLTYNCPWNQRYVAIQPHLLGLPLSVPHFGMTVIQCLATAFFSMPIAPIIASPIFLPSYLRPVKFWEKEYHTKRREAEQANIQQGTTSIASNLNSLYYSYMQKQLEAHLARDVLLGHLGAVSLGDVFVLTDFENHMTAFVHIVGLGCDYVRFQLRGLEFGGTFCHARELEALEANAPPFNGTFLPRVRRHLLPWAYSMQRRWMTWRNVQHQYRLPGYSISMMKGSFWFMGNELMAAQSRNQCLAIIYMVSVSDHLAGWLAPDALPALQRQFAAGYVDKDRVFRGSIEPDYANGGVELAQFFIVFGDWLRVCMQHREQHGGTAGAAVRSIDLSAPTSRVVVICYGLAVALRRLILLAARKHPGDSDAYLHGLLTAFSGHVDPVHLKDEWILEGEGMTSVLRSAARAALVLQKEFIGDPSALSDYEYLHPALRDYLDPLTGMVICPESDPAWAEAVMSDRPSLLSLRFNRDDTSDNKEFFIMVLTRMTRNFRISKVNREAVRGFWAAQQQEVLWLRNTYSERGSIQNAAPVLRNLINQSCDQPIGYPTFVSPLAVSSLPEWDYKTVFFNALRSLQSISLFSKPANDATGLRRARHRSDSDGPEEGVVDQGMGMSARSATASPQEAAFAETNLGVSARSSAGTGTPAAAPAAAAADASLRQVLAGQSQLSLAPLPTNFSEAALVLPTGLSATAAAAQPIATALESRSFELAGDSDVSGEELPRAVVGDA